MVTATASAAPVVPATSASNALFLVAFGMFLTIAVIPALLSALIRTTLLLTVLSIACVAMNPNDHSFACWITEQEDIDLRLKKEKPGVKQWLTAVVKTAIAMVTQEPLTWTYHNALLFSVVFVPALNRYAFGCLGNWWWADKHPRLLPLCKAQWLAAFTRGGSPSGIEHYMDEDSPEQRRRMSRRGATGAPPSRSFNGAAGIGGNDALRQRRPISELEDAATAFASSMSDLADTLQSTINGSSNGSSNGNSGFSTAPHFDSSSTATGSSDRALRANAIKAKINKDWSEAARLFTEASRAALSLMSRTNYTLEAAWCEVEQATVFPNQTSRLAKLVDNVCEELASAGFFDDAARALSDFARRLKLKFPQDTQNESVAYQLGDLYSRAQAIAEAGNSTRAALENGLRAASIYAEASLWQLAEERFEAVAKIQLKANRPAEANESFGNAVLCRVGLLDVGGADQLAQVYHRMQLTSQGMSEGSDTDALLESVFKAYEKGSTVLLESAIKRYESRQRMQPWQLKCLVNLHAKINSSDLR